LDHGAALEGPDVVRSDVLGANVAEAFCVITKAASLPTCGSCVPLDTKKVISETFFPAKLHYTPFNGPLSGTTRVSRYQKGKTDLDFTEARDSEWQ